jgi:thiol-disulfide isomerase/thioredoxin
MKDGRIVVAAGCLIVLAILGFFYFGKNTPVPPSAPENQAPISSPVADENKAPISSTAPTENKVEIYGASENQAPASSVTPTETKIPLSPTATIEEAKKNGESMWLFFRSDTCAPCVEMQKIFDQLESDYIGKVRFISIDVNDRNNMEIIKTWRIQYIPTSFIIDSTGKVSYQNIGIIPVENLKKELSKVVK